jgi:hypothetical protein
MKNGRLGFGLYEECVDEEGFKEREKQSSRVEGSAWNGD